MKIIFSISLFLTTFYFLKAQEPFIHLGAEWTYEEVYYDFTQFPHPKITYSLTNLKYTNDEVINGKLFKLIEGNNETYYIHENDGVIYYLHPGDTINLFKLFDFNVLPKDSFFITNELGDTIKVQIDTIYNQLIEGVITKTHRAIFNRPDDPDTLHMNFNNRIGPLDEYFLYLKKISFQVDECWHCNTLRCYSDNEISLYNPEDIPCDSIKTSITILTDYKLAFNVYPNPIQNNSISVYAGSTANGEILFELIDTSGKTIQKWNRFHIGPTTYALTLDQPANGLFFIRILFNQDFWHSKLFIE
ncbi:MAG: T9SS type A sorting domain-containing protein [Saprospiraceae bacterium]|nr:T9SS type A sorting domain-containing protein [Saprospiraceae bacterium]